MTLGTILLIIIPVLLPTAVALGIDPVHFGVVAVLNIMIGLITPPYGLLLFMMVKIAEVPLRDLVREAAGDSLGSRAMLNALSTALFALTLRLASEATDAPAGLLALAGNPRLAPALAAMRDA